MGTAPKLMLPPMARTADSAASVSGASSWPYPGNMNVIIQMSMPLFQQWSAGMHDIGKNL